MQQSDAVLQDVPSEFANETGSEAEESGNASLLHKMAANMDISTEIVTLTSASRR